MPSVVKLPSAHAVLAEGGDWSWSNPTQAYSDSDSDALAVCQVNNASFPLGQRIALTGFGFAIPTNAYLQGVKAEYRWKNLNGFAGSTWAHYLSFHISNTDFNAAGQPVNFGDPDHNSQDAYSNSMQLPTSLGIYTIGGPTTFPPNQDASSLTIAKLNDSNFGVKIQVYTSTTLEGIAVDYVRLTAYYDFYGSDIQSMLLRGV